MTEIHILDVGCGNMQLIKLPDGLVFVYDCNITDGNEQSVLSYIKNAIGSGAQIDVFVNSHRDADHMRGIKKLNKKHPIKDIWDSGVPGMSPNSTEYKNYMELSRSVTSRTLEAKKYWEYGSAVLRCMNSKSGDYTDPNDQSIVLKVEDSGSSLMLTGDTSFRPWKEKILPSYSSRRLGSSILLAAHHGSLTFFDDPSDEEHYYTDHIKKVAPAMTLVSVGSNTHDLPDDKAMELYEKYSSGSNKGNKVYTTEGQGNMLLTLKDDGGWNLKVDQ